MEDISYSDINRLKRLNAVLLMELTTSHSDMDRLKYLNIILLTELKNFIQRENHFQNEHLDIEDSSNLNDETFEPILRDNIFENEHLDLEDSSNSNDEEFETITKEKSNDSDCLLYTSPSPRDLSTSRMPSSA